MRQPRRDGLRDYREKRDFHVTPEPAGAVSQQRGRRFVIQKHAASRMHYDFRLELEGVLKSWAVPKGPSLDPKDKRLAMPTEDHPLEYADFEGVIPQGQYGGGTVVVWDRGDWIPEGDPHQGYRDGSLTFQLRGSKLNGAWTLIRTHIQRDSSGRPAWLLMKKADAHARPAESIAIVDAFPDSAVTGRTLAEVAGHADRVWVSNRTSAHAPRLHPLETPGARPGQLPETVAPQLATLVTTPPVGPGWLHEIKLDGYRMQCRIQDGKATLLSRTGKDWTRVFPHIGSAAAALPLRNGLLDGEVVAVKPNGVTSFQELQNALSGQGRLPILYFVFDLIHLDGADLRHARLEDRKKLLMRLLGGAPGPIRYSQHVDAGGDAFFRQACRLKLEGMVSKQRDSPYVSGRGRMWLKTKCQLQQELVIGGYTLPTKNGRTGLGALLVGAYDHGGLRYAGKVGTGFSHQALVELSSRLAKLETEESPFQDHVRGIPEKLVRWVKPELVAEVSFTEWTREGKARHPSFLGLREDKRPQEVVREQPAEPPSPPPRKRHRVEMEGIRISHPDRALFPDDGLTKVDIAQYYISVARWMLPHVLNRPLTLVRCPGGIQQGCFFQKHASTYGVPDALHRIPIQEKEKVGEYLLIQSASSLVGLVQMDILEVHTWNSVSPELEKPNRLVFDLDPGDGVDWSEVISATKAVRGHLADLGLRSFVKTTGGKGLHVVVPIQPEQSWETCSAFAHAAADAMARMEPHRFTTRMAKLARRNRIFIDHLRNVRGATSVAAFSTRAKPGAPISMPLDWDELESLTSSRQWTVRNALRALESRTHAAWDGWQGVVQRLPLR